ncbi:MAG: hypothetical protein ACF787_09895, partial [Rhodopirellula sp. JB053]
MTSSDGNVEFDSDKNACIRVIDAFVILWTPPVNHFQLAVFRDEKEVFAGKLPLPVELGRQRDDDAGVCSVQDLGGRFRVAITPADVLSVPREALLIESTPGGIQIRNIHRYLTFDVGSPARSFGPGESITCMHSVMLQLPSGFSLSFEVPSSVIPPLSESEGDDDTMRTMQGSFDLSEAEETPASLNAFLHDDESVDRGRMIVGLVNQALEVVQKSAGSDEFLETAAKSAAQMILLDNAYVILRNDSEWRVVSS